MPFFNFGCNIRVTPKKKFFFGFLHSTTFFLFSLKHPVQDKPFFVSIW